ncbi:MAG: hypothetical protein IIC51_08250 [Planctomycetes bacterium]|nr:hypothetical protein [Planctomycetota bacterium]
MDRIIQEASSDQDDQAIRALATAIRTRRPPKLLKEVAVLETKDSVHRGTLFKNNVKLRARRLADEHGIPLGQFMYCETRQLSLEVRGSTVTADEARDLPSEQSDELVKIFVEGDEEPRSIVDIKHSIIRLYSGHVFQMFRLYTIYEGSDESEVITRLRDSVKDWGRS